VDAVSLDRLIEELRLEVADRHLSRPRLVGRDAVAFEVSGTRERWLWLDASRSSPGLYLIPRDDARRLSLGPGDTVPHRSRQALLHLRKHAHGARLRGLARVEGERTLVLDLGASRLALRLGGRAPALTLARDGQPLATLGDGPAVWPLPPAAPEKEWSRIGPAAFAASVEAARARGRSLASAILAACPGLGPVLARELDGGEASFDALRARLAEPCPVLLVPAAAELWHDADLAAADAVALVPVPLDHPGRVRLEPRSWIEASALFLLARRRGAAFAAARTAALTAARRDVRRLEQLGVNLASDLASLADPGALRREAETLLASGRRLAAGAESVELDDPWQPGRRRLVRLDPRLDGPANAERLFDQARRTERAARQVDLRRRETLAALVEARARETLVAEARDLAALAARPARGRGAESDGPGGPRHYLTGAGLSILVGRGARENHHLTFRVARPDDLWLHARDVPGAHVVLRDNEGRAGAADLREAAEVAAFFSEAREASVVDVHVTRRKHVRPARGGPGRVFVAHSDTLRVAPRDPEGRLRRR
jgi:hypothetical protein